MKISSFPLNKELNDLPQCTDYVIEYSYNENSGYKKYKSGWIKQWGVLPNINGGGDNNWIDFKPPFPNKMHIFSATAFNGSQSSASVFSIASLTKEKIQLRFSISSPYLLWCAEGI